VLEAQEAARAMPDGPRRRLAEDSAPWILPPLRPGERESSRDRGNRRACEAVLRVIAQQHREAEAAAAVQASRQPPKGGGF
jgi:hypothetical protein